MPASASTPARELPSPSEIPPSPYAAGDMVAGKYLLERVVGEGGMGSVWLAHNMDLDAPVALKLVRTDVATSDAADRLKREARVEAQIQHRAIVRVFDFGETERGDPFIVMEHLEGESLADALDERWRISATTAVRILLPIVDGLSAAHAQGIVHRDVKPENIFLARGPRGVQPKVVDFGIAKLDRWDPKPSLTLQGAVLGSPSYMSPEQARGLADVDHRADVWAVCAVLYEAVTGSPPFRGESYNALLRSIVEDEITPLSLAGGADAALWTVLERGFAKDRRARFQSMRELGQALARFLLAQGITEDVCGDALVSTWELDGESSELLSLPRAAYPVGPVAPSPSALPVSTVSLSPPGVAPTSTSGLVTPSRVARTSRDHPVVLPLVAVFALLVGVASATWGRADPATNFGATASAAEELPVMSASAAPLAPPPEVTPAPGAQAAAPSTPAAAPLGKVEEPPARPIVSSVRRAPHHGWPATTGATARPGLPLRARVTADDTARTLGLKAPYR